jgi:hypothetical protein
LRVVETVANAQWWGKVTGCLAGGAGAGASAWYLARAQDIKTNILILYRSNHLKLYEKLNLLAINL